MVLVEVVELVVDVDGLLDQRCHSETKRAHVGQRLGIANWVIVVALHDDFLDLVAHDVQQNA